MIFSVVDSRIISLIMGYLLEVSNSNGSFVTTLSMIFSVTCHLELRGPIFLTIDMVSLPNRVVNVVSCPND